MKKIPVAPIAVIVLWFGLSAIWMSGSGAAQDAAPTSQLQMGQPAPQSCAMMASKRGGAAGTGAAMPGGGMSSPQQSVLQGADDGGTAVAARPAPLGTMTEPTAPILGLQELFATPPAPTDVMTRLQVVEDRLAAALLRLESVGTVDGAAAATTRADRQPSPSWVSQLFSVIVSGPVIGFLVVLLFILAATARGWSILQGGARWLQRSSNLQAAWASARGRKIRAAVLRKQRQALSYLKSTGLDNPQERSLHWARVEGFQKDVISGIRPLLTRMGLMRQSTSPGEDQASVTASRVYGELIHATDANGKLLTAGVFEDGQVRAAAGLTLAIGAIAFAYAYFAQVYAPIQIVTTLFFFEFLIRVTVGIGYSPMGMIAHRMTRRQTPQWVSAQPKRFAWTLGLVMSLAMMIITNSGIRGPLPLTICLICLTLMWLEAVLGLCLGCEIHRQLVRLGWMQPDKDFEICANGSCSVQPQPQFAR